MIFPHEVGGYGRQNRNREVSGGGKANDDRMNAASKVVKVLDCRVETSFIEDPGLGRSRRFA